MRADPNGGYQRYRLSREGKTKTVLVHRLMAQVFLPNPLGLPVVRHLDDDRSNNTLGNLAWGTHAENTADAVRNGRWLNRGEFRRTCKAGLHDWVPENIRSSWNTDRGGRLVETCRRCEQARRRARHEREIAERGGPQKPGPKSDLTPEQQQERDRERHREWARAHRERETAAHREWAAKNRERLAEYARERRAQKRGS